MRTLRHILIACALTGISLGIVFAVGLWNFRTRALYTKDHAKIVLTDAAGAMKDMDPGRAGLYLTTLKDQLRALNATLSLWRQFVPFLDGAAAQLHAAQGLADASVDVAQGLDYLKRNGARLILNGKGPEFIAALKRLHKNIAAVAPTADKEQVYAAQTAIDAAIAWLDAGDAQNVVILFQNPSEIRPGGGFLGSFAHITLNHASMTSLEVQDIYDPDGQMTQKIIPPVALQRLTPNWGARDANWFPDFPTSARKVMHFLEDSRIYRDRHVTFSGTIAINITLLRDILDITGPLEIPADDGTTMTLSADTFLADLQTDVETKQSKGILKQATPALFAKLDTLDESQKKRLVEAVAARFANKDIMAYFRDPALESFAKRMGAAGELYPTPPDFAGGYMSVADANIAGGKADAYTAQSIALDETVNRDGTVADALTVVRAHHGGERAEPFYRAMNRTYMQILAAPLSALSRIEGGYDRDIVPTLDYAKAGYATDPDLAGDPGKAIFATWLDLEPGATKTISASWTRNAGLSFDAPRTPYRFVFDKQSGVNGPLDVTLHAPAGMLWTDSGTDTFAYHADNPPARVTLDLTLMRR